MLSLRSERVPLPTLRHRAKRLTITFFCSAQPYDVYPSTQRVIAINKCRGTDLQACGRNGTVIAEPVEFQMAKTPAAKPAKAASAAVKAPRKSDALQKPLTPSAELAVIVGTDPLSRGQVVAKVWEYIKKHNLQDAADRRQINADAALKKIFGKDSCSMFEMNKHIAGHLK